MNKKFIKASTGLILLTAVIFAVACRQTANSEQNAASTPTPAANSTPETTRGCPAGTKPCGDACIPRKQNCGGN